MVMKKLGKNFRDNRKISPKKIKYTNFSNEKIKTITKHISIHTFKTKSL
jgi:hypothetical protein